VTRPRLTSRKYGASGHAYYIDEVKVDGVTTILNSLPKNLTQWAADSAAEEALNNWEELTALPLTKRMDRIRYAHRNKRDTAAMRGTEIHKLAVGLYGGLPVEVPGEHKGPVEAWARTMDAWKIEPIAAETPLVNLTYRYGGTADLWAYIGVRDNVRALVDLKTGNNVYESTVLQLTGYRNCDLWQPATTRPDGKPTTAAVRQASEEPLPAVEETWVAHILPDTVRFRPVKTDGQFRAFLYVQQVHKWLERHGFKGEEPLIDEPQLPGGNYVFD
jgi:hypothetical protein